MTRNGMEFVSRWKDKIHAVHGGKVIGQWETQLQLLFAIELDKLLKDAARRSFGTFVLWVSTLAFVIAFLFILAINATAGEFDYGVDGQSAYEEQRQEQEQREQQEERRADYERKQQESLDYQRGYLTQPESSKPYSAIAPDGSSQVCMYSELTRAVYCFK